jgi:CheY-like chemotaxis protein
VLHLEGMNTVRVDRPQPDTEAVPAVQPDVVLIDLALRGGCGIEVATELQQNGFASIPMIALSASLGELELARQSELFRLVIPKPFDIHQLLVSISEAAPS